MQKPNMCVRRGIASVTGVHAVVVLQPNQNWTITMQLEQGCVQGVLFPAEPRIGPSGPCRRPLQGFCVDLLARLLPNRIRALSLDTHYWINEVKLCHGPESIASVPYCDKKVGPDSVARRMLNQ